MCRDDEVVDIAGARLATVMTSWEYLLLRVQQEDEGNSSAPLIPRILNEATSLMAKVATVAGDYLHPSKMAGQENHVFQLNNAKTAQLVDLPCGTYYISKDDRKLLEDTLLDDSVEEQQQRAQKHVSNNNNSTTAVDSDAANKTTSNVTSDLWEELEEATSHLPTTAAESTTTAAQDNELMQVDEIVNQVVGATSQQTLT